MRRYYPIVVIFICTLLTQIGCQQEAKAAQQKQTDVSESQTIPNETGQAKAEIYFENVTHDFGEINPKSKHYCEFTFKNIGDDTLKITKISKTCGCTPFTLDKMNYKPNETGTLKVEYNAGKETSSVNKQLFVHSNDAKHPKVVITIKAEIMEKVTCKPGKLNLLPKKDNAGCPEIIIESLDEKPFSIKKITSTSDCITVDFDPKIQQKKFVLQPKVDTKRLEKGMNGRLTIIASHKASGEMTVIFNTLDEFTVSPASIVVLHAEADKQIDRELWILNNYMENFDVESVTSKKGLTKVLKQEKIENRYRFDLAITPPSVKDSNPRIFTDTIYINLKNGKKLDVMIRGFYSKKPEK